MINDKKVIHRWCMYDWANSVYSLTITSAIFPIYYQAVAIGPNGSDRISFFGWEVINSVLYSYALSASFLVVAIILPILSGIADYAGRKKFFLKTFMLIGSFSCIGLFFFTSENIEWGILCSFLASIGYSGSLVFYDAFLHEIASEDQKDLVSAKGYAYGYIGGVILLIINLAVIQLHEALGLPDEGVATRIAFLTVGLWWIGFSLYALAKLPEKKRTIASDQYLLNGYKELRMVWLRLKELPTLRRFLLAFFFYNMGVQTFMYLAATFGSKELKMEATQLILTILLIQFLAVAGSYFFAYLSKKKGNIFALVSMVVIWIFACLGAYFVVDDLTFYVLASVVGLIMGGIQALSRATYSKVMPTETPDTASFFSFYDVTYNLSIVGGTLAFGFMEQLTGSMRNGTLALTLFFMVGLVFLLRVKMNNEAA